MKRLYFFLALVATLCLCGSSLHAQHAGFANYKRYHEANLKLPEPTREECRVVFLGNSITDNWARMRPDFFAPNGFVGRGISGQTTYQFLLRFREDVINLHPRVLVLNGGTNDIAENTGPYDEDITFGNICSMVELARYHKIRVVLTSLLPAGSFPWRREIEDSMEKIRRLNARIKAYADEHHLTYVDYFTPLLSDDGTALRADYSSDGVHPNVAGYEVMEALVLRALKK